MFCSIVCNEDAEYERSHRGMQDLFYDIAAGRPCFA